MGNGWWGIGGYTPESDYNQSVNAIAIPDSGFVFGGWSGDVNSRRQLFPSLDGNYELNATNQDLDDDECNLCSSDRDTDDDDGDGDEVSIGLDPVTDNTALVNFFTIREETARSDGNASGFADDTDGDGFNDYDENQTVGLDPLVENSNLYSYVTDREQTACGLQEKRRHRQSLPRADFPV